MAIQVLVFFLKKNKKSLCFSLSYMLNNIFNTHTPLHPFFPRKHAIKLDHLIKKIIKRKSCMFGVPTVILLRPEI
jgi:hypothetical protein